MLTDTTARTASRWRTAITTRRGAVAVLGVLATLVALVTAPAQVSAAPSCAANQWLATYYNSTSVGTNPVGSACVATVAGDWGTGYPSGVGVTGHAFAVRYTRSVDFGSSGAPASFDLAVSGHAIVSVGNSAILDKTSSSSTKISGKKGVQPVQVDFSATKSTASVRLDFSTAAVDGTAPKAPGSVKAAAATGGVTVTWGAVSDGALGGYSVYRSTTSTVQATASNRLGTVSGTANRSLLDTTAVGGSTYYYAVTASDTSGNESVPSSAAKVTAIGASADGPAAPTNLTAKAASSGTVSLSWTKSTSTIKGYLLSRSTAADGTFAALTTAPITSTSYTDGGAPRGATAYYRLQAVDSTGRTSTVVPTSVAVPADTTPPAAPSSAKSTPTPNVGVTISWSANKEADLAGYTVDKRNAAGAYVRYLPTTGTVLTTTSFFDNSVPEGTSAYYRIRAVDTSGNVSSYSSVTGVLADTAPAAPASLAATPSTQHGITLTWKANSEPDLAGYTVYRAATSTGSFIALTTLTTSAAGASPTFTDTSAPKGVASYYKVSAVDFTGNTSKQSGVASSTATTDPVAIPVTYTHISVGPQGDYPTIAAALATVPANNITPTELDIAPGTYHESVEIDTPNVLLKGTSGDPNDVIITDDKASGTIDPSDGQPYGTAGSATMYVSAANVRLQDLSVVNAFDEAAHPEIANQQAVALRVEGDRFMADDVRLIGNQDTLLADTPKPTTRIRQYYVNSYIEGDVDYLFGAATAVFDHDTLRSLDRGKSDNGAITAASTDKGSKYGFLITNSRVVSDAAAGTVHLGRPWHPGADPNAIASVVYSNTILPAAIATSAPWEDMAVSDASGTKVNFHWQDARFDEYLDLGPGAGVNANRPQLSAKDGAAATPAKYLAGSDGWNPVVSYPVNVAPAAPTGLTAAADNRLVNLAWDESTSPDVTGYAVYRAAAGDATFTQVATGVTAPRWSDTSVTNGTSYQYAITAIGRGGVESVRTSAVTVLVEAAPLVTDLTVDPSRPASATVFPTIAAALAAAPAGTAVDPTVIDIVPGTYSEYPVITKPYLVLRGTTGTAGDVVITGNRASGTPLPDGSGTYGTSGSATMVLSGTGDQLRDLTVQNSYQEGTYANGQAVALRTTGDKLVIDDVRLLGNQDTVYANSPNTTTVARAYFHDCYIEGDVDFLFGRATAVFDHCTLKALDHGTSPNGAVTSASTNAANPYGFLITGSRIIGTAPDGSENLGRPWQPGVTQPDGTTVADPTARAQVTVRDSWLGSVVSGSSTWTDMVNSGTTTHWQSARFSEYHNSGPGAAVGPNRPQLSDSDAATYTAQSYLAGSDNWDPVADPAIPVAPAPVAGLAAAGDDRQVTLSWTDNVESDVVGYRVYRSTDATVPTDSDHLVATVTKPAYTDTTVQNGTTYHYVVVALTSAQLTSPAGDPVSALAGPKPLVADLTVAADGSGDYTSLQAAVAAAPAGTAARRTVIIVKPGTYREVVNIAKPYLTIAGSTGDPRDVVLTFDNANGTTASASTCPAVTTATCGTAGSATVTAPAANLTMRDLTIANTFDSSKHPEIGPYNTQAVALRATGDKQVYNDVRLLGVQDTLNADAAGNISADGSGYPRQYYVNSVLQGNVDFVFGRATAVFDRDTFVATTHSGGTVFAPSTASRARGYLVTSSRIVSSNDPGTFYLGRPWRAWSDGAYADNARGQTVIRDTWIGDGFTVDHPWTDFAPNFWTDGRFDEYHNSGPGATTNANRPTLDDTAAKDITAAAYLAGTDGWNPVLDASLDTAPAAPTGVIGAPGDGQAGLSWAENAESDVVGYHVYRVTAASGDVPIDAGHRVDTAVLTRAGFTDTGVHDGTSYRYAVTAVDAAGNESAPSAPVTITPALHIDAVVATDGSGDYTTVQAAVNAIADGHVGRTVIEIKPGTYSGAVSVPAAKGSVTLLGSTGTASDVVLTNATATPTLTLAGNLVTVTDLTLANTAGVNNSPAVSTTGDRILLDHVALTGTDRVVWADVPTAGATSHVLIENSTITGTTNVILGRATLAVHASTITATATSGTLLIPSTTADGGHGFLITDSTITPAAGVSDVRLGGPYAQGTTTSTNAPEAVIRNTVIGAGIKSQPWQDFNGYTWTDARFAEYANTGAGATVSDLRPQLTPAASTGYTVNAWLGGGSWYPAIADPATPSDVTAPAAAGNLQAAAGDRTVTLTWAPPADTDVAGYRLYRSTSATVPLTYATLVKSGITASTYTDTGLTNGKTYTYALVTVDKAGNTSPAAPVSAAPADSAPPATPTGVTGGAGDGRVTLTWTANTEPDLAGYNVYRAGGAKLNGALLTAPSFADTGLVNGTSYGYTVTAVDTAGNESAPSAEVDVVPVAGDHTAPAVPTGLAWRLGRGSVTVRWTADTDTDLAGYTVYRASGGGTPVAVSGGLITGTTFTDTTVTVGTTYTYSVSASDKAGNESARSTSADVTPIKVDVLVAADGSGDATTVSAGIKLLADNADYTGQGGRTVLIEPGTYAETVVVGNRYGVRLVGATADPHDVVITASGTGPTVPLAGNQWTLRNLTVANTATGTAPALQVASGDKDVFDNVRLLGDHQVLQLSTANTTTFSRMYFHAAYIQGGADTVLGRAVAVFDHCTFHILDEPGASLTDSSVDASSPYGFLITDSTITTDGAARVTAGTGGPSIYLGRPYSTQGKAQVVIRNTSLDAGVYVAKPWNDYGTVSWTAGRFFEYHNSGPGAAIPDPSTRPQLSDSDAASYTAASYLAGTDGWNPIA